MKSNDGTIQMKALCLYLGSICFSKFHKMKFGHLVEICFCLNLAVKGLNQTGARQKKERLEKYIYIPKIEKIGKSDYHSSAALS